MVSTAIVHVIGTVTLVVILLFVIVHVNNMIMITTYNIEKHALENIAGSIAYEIAYMLSQNTNMTYNIYHPVLLSNDQGYNIIIGSGKTIIQKYPQLAQLNPAYLYVVAMIPSGNIYAVEQVCPLNLYGKTIVLTSDPIIIGSTYDFKLNITITSTEIIIKPILVGVIAK